MTKETIYDNLEKWLNEDVIRQISLSNSDPDWMLKLRMEAFEKYKKTPLPSWWPDLSGLNLEDIYYFAKPSNSVKNADDWEKVPENIKNIFEKLKIPEAEREILAWVWAQFDSEVVYHSMKKEWEDLWIIFEDMSLACKNHPDLLKKYFSRSIPISDHKFSMLHYAVWSWWTFLYIPKNIEISEPLQSYFRMNVKAWWQFEHTIIVIEEWSKAHYIEWCSAPKYWSPSLHAWWVEIFVWKNAHLRYSSVENWSSDTYNLNTKRAILNENSHIEWVWWNMWAWVTMLYPCSVLLWDWSSADHLWLAFASDNQIIDSWAKVIHIWQNTKSNIISKWISKDNWVSIYRWLLDIKETAINSISNIVCDSLLLDENSKSIAIPYIKTANDSNVITHEASAWKINEEHIFYLSSRWIDQTESQKMIVNWFLSPIMKELPLEYASEMNVLIGMQLDKN